MSIFRPATREQTFLRLVLHGAPGAGKTWTALTIAHYLSKLYGYGPNSIAIADTERSSAAKYVGEIYNDEGDTFEFLTVADEFFKGDYSIKKLETLVNDVQKEKIPILVIDSLSHFWNGTGGILEYVDNEANKMKNPNTYVAWKKGDAVYRQLVQSLVSAKVHLICTLRSKMEYGQKENHAGKKELQRLGMAPEIRDHFISEMDVEGYLDEEHKLRIGKNRCRALDGGVYLKPGLEVAQILYDWNTSGANKRDIFGELKVALENSNTKQDLSNAVENIRQNKIFLSTLEVEELLALHKEKNGTIQ